MSYSVQTLQSDLTAMLHGQTLNQITNINGLINRAARQVLLDIDPQETKRIEAITGAVFNGVWDYPAPTDLKGNKVIDIRPQVLRYPNDVWGQQYNQAFDLAKNNTNSVIDSFTINFDTGVKAIRINSPSLPAPTVLNMCDTLTGNGTWETTGFASNLSIDNVNFVSGSGALEFDMTSIIGGVFNDTMTAIDLSTQLNQSTLFIYTYLPTASSFTSISLTWGSSDSDYYSLAVQTNQQGNDFEDGWNTLAFPWEDALVTGNPDPSSITTLQVVYITDGTAQTGIRLGQISSNMGRILNLEYYSKYMFRDGTTGAFKENVTATSDLVNLDTDSYNILLYQCGLLAAQQQQGIDALFFDSNFFLQKYNDAVAQYKSTYKSEVQLPQASYYRMKRGGYGAWGPLWNNG